MSSNLPPGVTQSMIDGEPDAFEEFEGSKEFASLTEEQKEIWADLMESEKHFDLLNNLVVFICDKVWEDAKMEDGMYRDMYLVPKLREMTEKMIMLVQGREE